MNNLKNLTYIFLFSLVVLSCNKKPLLVEPDFGYDYYPNDSSYYRLYEVQDILYNDFQQTIDTVNYQMVEIFEKSFSDLENRDSKILHRYTKTSNSNWQLRDVWQSTKTTTRVEQVEENVRTVKLIFPIKVGSNWNGYAFADLGEETFEIASKVTDTIINQIDINELITVTHYNNTNFIEKQIELEKYGKEIGLVHRYYVNLNLQKDSGIIRSTWIKDFGFNFQF